MDYKEDLQALKEKINANLQFFVRIKGEVIKLQRLINKIKYKKDKASVKKDALRKVKSL